MSLTSSRNRSNETAFEVLAADSSATHCFADILFKETPIGLQDFSSLFVEWVFRIGFQKQVLQSIHNGVDCKDRFPIFAQDVETDVAFQIDVRVIDFSLALDFGSLMWIVGIHFKTEREAAVFVEALNQTTASFSSVHVRR